MRITFLLTQSLESPGGGGRFFPLARALSDLGHQVTILALHHNFTHLQQRRFTRDGVAVWYVGQMHVGKVGNEKIYFSPPRLLWTTAVATLKLTWAAWRTPSDLFHVCKAQPMNGVAAWIAHKLRRVPVYLDSDDYEAANNRFGGRWQQRIVAWFENWFASFVAGITVNNRFIARHFEALGYPPQRIALVPNGVDRERFAVLETEAAARQTAVLRHELGLEPDARPVVYIGSMSLTSHAVDLLLHAFPLVREQIPAVRLLLVGGGEDLPALRQLAADLGLAAAVHFTGRIPSDQIPFYYHLADLTVDPRRDSLAARSSLPLKLVETVAAATPCVTTDIGDYAATVGAAGLAVPPDDAAALAAGIIQILGDGALAERMRTAARQLRQNYWWDRRVRDFARLYPSSPDNETSSF